MKTRLLKKLRREARKRLYIQCAFDDFFSETKTRFDIWELSKGKKIVKESSFSLDKMTRNLKLYRYLEIKSRVFNMRNKQYNKQLRNL